MNRSYAQKNTRKIVRKSFFFLANKQYKMPAVFPMRLLVVTFKIGDMSRTWYWDHLVYVICNNVTAQRRSFVKQICSKVFKSLTKFGMFEFVKITKNIDAAYGLISSHAFLSCKKYWPINWNRDVLFQHSLVAFHAYSARFFPSITLFHLVLGGPIVIRLRYM